MNRRETTTADRGGEIGSYRLKHVRANDYDGVTDLDVSLV
jgi:hypothetical protein